MTSNNLLHTVVVCAVSLPLLAPSTFAAGDPDRGARAFGACAACHSLEPGRHLTGPSLAGIYGRTAGTIEDFGRYSEALAASGIKWNESNLDAWVADPQALVPGNLMTFPGINEAQTRADLVAFLKQADASHVHEQAPRTGGMMAAPRLPDLKQLSEEHRVKKIRYCGDSYFVTTATGETVPFWEFNLRFKTDSDPRTGPSKDKPVIVGAGMRGDRASIVFNSPEEISGFIERRCE